MVDLLFDISLVATRPGETAMNKIPSFLYWASNLAIAMLSAPLLMLYGPPSTMENWVMKSGSAIPEDMAMIFFARPLRINGSAKLKRWTLPRVLILKDSSMSSSNCSGSSPLRLVRLYSLVDSWFDLQSANGVVSRPIRLQGSIGDDVVETTTGNFGGFFDKVLFELVN